MRAVCAAHSSRAPRAPDRCRLLSHLRATDCGIRYAVTYCTSKAWSTAEAPAAHTRRCGPRPTRVQSCCPRTRLGARYNQPGVGLVHAPCRARRRDALGLYPPGLTATKRWLQPLMTVRRSGPTVPGYRWRIGSSYTSAVVATQSCTAAPTWLRGSNASAETNRFCGRTAPVHSCTHGTANERTHPEGRDLVGAGIETATRPLPSGTSLAHSLRRTRRTRG